MDAQETINFLHTNAIIMAIEFLTVTAIVGDAVYAWPISYHE